MKKIILTIFDLLFPRRKNDEAIHDILPADFYKMIPRWHGEIYPDMQAIFHYKDPTTKAMIKELKSSKNRHAAQIAAHALANFLEENAISDAIIVPMPISKKRRKKRGYNQCEMLADFLIKDVERRKMEAYFTDINYEIRNDILLKSVDTAKLAFENRASRLKANEGVFKETCDLSHLEKPIIVIDDVITTGSTMHSAMITLRAAGAKRVTGIGIAH